MPHILRRNKPESEYILRITFQLISLNLNKDCSVVLDAGSARAGQPGPLLPARGSSGLDTDSTRYQIFKVVLLHKVSLFSSLPFFYDL